MNTAHFSLTVRPPHEGDPGDGWYRLTWGTLAGWWVDTQGTDTLMFPTGDVIFAQDCSSFLARNPGLREEVE